MSHRSLTHYLQEILQRLEQTQNSNTASTIQDQLQELQNTVQTQQQKVPSILNLNYSDEKKGSGTVNIVVKPGHTLSFLASVFGVTLAQILSLNPGIVNPNTIYPGQIIRIPASPPVGPDPGITPAQHLVRPGDSLFLIARQYQISLASLLGVNPQIPDPDRLFIHQVINLPTFPPPPPSPTEEMIQLYVRVGETLSSIARRVNVPLSAIIDANPQIEDPNVLFAGQIINIPLQIPERVLSIVVKPGDTLSFYSRVFGISISQILAANPGIIDPNVLFVGQIIRIPAAPPVGPHPGFARAQHLVRTGNTLFSIARQFGISLSSLIAANPQIPNPDVISVQQVVNLPVQPPSPPDPPMNTIQIYVSAGETMSSIARRVGLPLSTLINANPQIPEPDLLLPGQLLNIPLGS